MRKIAILIVLTACAAFLHAQEPKREMRGTWIATVANIDWPLAAGADAEKQQKDLITILDNCVESRLNTVMFQIRPTADALYDSAHEPWSHWLTGTQGKAPAYDPLEFLIEECDKRGLAVHVWINPYRVWLDNANLPADLKRTIYEKYGEYLVTYGTTTYFQPADERSRNHIVKVVADIVEKYDIDAIHMDDYFYPYRIAGQEFPDADYFRRDPRGFTDKEDWRRDNVDLTIKAISETIKDIKPWVEFGISPFGVWRNASRDSRGSATRGGQTNYDDLYADILKWEQEGWIDYVSPQLYWQIGFAVADYKILADWWDKNANGTPTYIGHALYRVEPRSSTAAWRSYDEIVRQIQLNRTHANIQGSILYSAKFLARSDFQRTIRQVYSHPTLWPVNPRIEAIVPEPPGFPYLIRGLQRVSITWQPEADNRRYVVYRFPRGTEHPDFEDASNIVCITGKSSIVIPSANEPLAYDYYISALSLTHHESVALPVMTGIF